MSNYPFRGLQLLFICGNVPSSAAPHLDILMLADTRATNSCISLGTLSTLGYGKEDLCTDVQYLLTNVTEHNIGIILEV